MEMISRYLTWHYQGNLAPTLPAEGGK
jgi:hypothetical protein